VRAIIILILFTVSFTWSQDQKDCIDCESRLEGIIPEEFLTTFDENFQKVINQTRCEDKEGSKLFHMLKENVDTSSKSLYDYFFGDGITYKDKRYKAGEETRKKLHESFNIHIMDRSVDHIITAAERRFLIYQMPIVYNRLSLLMHIPFKRSTIAFNNLVKDTKRVRSLMKQMGITSYEQLDNFMKGIQKGSQKYLDDPTKTDPAKIKMHKKRLKALSSFKRLNSGHYGIHFKNIFKGLGKNLLKSLYKGLLLGLAVELSLSHGKHPLHEVKTTEGNNKYLRFLTMDPQTICMTFINFQNNCFDYDVKCKYCSEKLQNKKYGQLSGQEFVELFEGLQKQNGHWGGCAIDANLISGLFSYYNYDNAFEKLKDTYLTDMISLMNSLDQQEEEK
jgi:hypothetical protein